MVKSENKVFHCENVTSRPARRSSPSSFTAETKTPKHVHYFKLIGRFPSASSPYSPPRLSSSPIRISFSSSFEAQDSSSASAHAFMTSPATLDLLRFTVKDPKGYFTAGTDSLLSSFCTTYFLSYYLVIRYLYYFLSLRRHILPHRLLPSPELYPRCTRYLHTRRYAST